VVVWHEENRVYANRITADGRSLDGRGISLGTGYDPAVAFDGKQFVVAFSELGSQFVALQFISPTEGLLHDVLRLRDVTGVPTVAEGGVGVLVAAAYGNQVSAAMVDRNLRVPVVTAQLWKLEYPSYVGQLRAAWNGKEFFVVWTELEWRGPWAPYTAYFQRILGGRVNTNLFMLDTQPRVLGDAGEEGDRNPALASDGNGWLVSWQFNGEVRARRIGGDGVPNGDDTGVRIASGVAPALAFDGTQYVVAWKGNEDPREVRVASETRTGALDSLTGTVIVATFLAERIEIVPTGLKTFAIVYSRISDPSLGFVPRAFVQRLFSPARRRSAR